MQEQKMLQKLQMQLASATEKLKSYAEDKHLDVDAFMYQFPIRFEVMPQVEDSNQMSMDGLEEASRFWKITFTFADELTLQIEDGAEISDEVLSKIKNMIIKYHDLYVRYFFANQHTQPEDSQYTAYTDPQDEGDGELLAIMEGAGVYNYPTVGEGSDE